MSKSFFNFDDLTVLTLPDGTREYYDMVQVGGKEGDREYYFTDDGKKVWL